MKITLSKLREFFENPGSCGSVLLYGSDPSRINHYTQKIIDSIMTKTAYAISRMDLADVSKEPEQLLVNLTTVPMFHQKSLIVLSGAKDALSTDLKSAIDNMNTDYCFVIVQARELSGTSSLRAYYNNHPKYASIACYKEDNINALVAEFLTENGVTYNSVAFKLLCGLLQGGGTCIKPELSKLLLFLGDKKVLDVEDIQQVFVADLDPALDDICVAIAAGDLKNFVAIADSLLHNKVTEVLILRSSMKYFMTLAYLMRKVRGGTRLDDAIKAIQPPIFFRLVPQLRQHATSLAYQTVQLILSKLHETEVQCKSPDALPEASFRYQMYLLIQSVKTYNSQC